MTYKLYYLPHVVSDRKTRHGFIETVGVEKYQGAKLRDKVVYRIDLLNSLVNEYLSGDTLCSYRDMLYNMIAGNISDKNFVSGIFKALYLQDTVFRNSIGEIIYFEESALENESLYAVVLKRMIARIQGLNKAIEQDLGSHGSRYLLTSHAYAYASVADGANAVAYIPKGCKGETVSYAKVWKSIYKEYGD